MGGTSEDAHHTGTGKSRDLPGDIEQLSERQKLLAVRLENMWILQKEALEKVHVQMFLQIKDSEERKI